jgi:hypothetical protein
MSMGSLGRFIHKDPLSGYSEQELVAEAKIRIEANRQRRRMKQLMAAASDDGFNVLTKDLLLAAKLAKVQLPDELIAETPYAAVRLPMDPAELHATGRRGRTGWPNAVRWPARARTRAYIHSPVSISL